MVFNSINPNFDSSISKYVLSLEALNMAAKIVNDLEAKLSYMIPEHTLYYLLFTEDSVYVIDVCVVSHDNKLTLYSAEVGFITIDETTKLYTDKKEADSVCEIILKMTENENQIKKLSSDNDIYKNMLREIWKM